MVRRGFVQRSVFEVVLPDGDQLWEPEVREIDEVRADDALVAPGVEALARRRPQSRRRGRPGVPADVVLRLLVLTHLYHWRFDECERTVRGSLVDRAFCRIDGERVPDAKTLIRLAPLVGPTTVNGLLARLVAVAHRRRVIRGQRLRVETTVVETPIPHPTDSTRLADGGRGLTRTRGRLRPRLGAAAPQIRDRTRSVGRRVFELTRRSRAATIRAGAEVRERAQARLTQLDRELMAITRAVLRQAAVVSQAIPARAGAAVRTRDRQRPTTAGLGQRVLAQTRARVLPGDTHDPDKVLSLFEPHPAAIRKGKAARPTEFGKLVKLQEAEAQFITDYAVYPTRVPDGELWGPALERHRELFGHAPQLAVADAGFASAANEWAATEVGGRRAVLPRRGRLSGPRALQQRQRWFRRALRGRTGCEGRIRALKRCHGLALPLPRPRGHGALGRARGDREQPAGAGSRGATATMTDVPEWVIGKERRNQMRQTG